MYPPPPAVFRCDHCGGMFSATVAQVRSYTRSAWPLCCGADMILYIQAPRPPHDATGAAASALSFPPSDPATDTAILPLPDPRSAGE